MAQWLMQNAYGVKWNYAKLCSALTKTLPNYNTNVNENTELLPWDKQMLVYKWNEQTVVPQSQLSEIMIKSLTKIINIK